MAFSADISRLYASDTGLLNRIRNAVGQHPGLESLFVDIAHYFTKSDETEEPGSKRRKKNDDSHKATDSNGINGQTSGKRTVVFEIKDVSFTMPQRKKMHWSLVHHGDHLTDPNTYSIQITDPKTGNIELIAPLSSYVQVLCLPVPEKPQPSFNYCFIPSNPFQDAVVFTLPEGRLTSTKYTFSYAESYFQAFPPLSSYPTSVRIIDEPLDRILPLHNLIRIEPDAQQFQSFFPEIQRKKEPAYHVKAHVGTKDGFLFFLRTGIFFGFKKPLKFLPLESIESTAFVRPVSRTFSLAITYREVGVNGDEGDEAVQEVEFDQIDNQEHTAINEYIQKNGIQDGSFAASRKAKIGKKDKGAAPGAGPRETNGLQDEGDGRTELEKAEQQIQDEEDEEEEDYEPDEDDDGDESGSESGDDKQYVKAKGMDLVKEELGSEAEDVSDDDDDDGCAEVDRGVEGEEDEFGEEEQEEEDEDEEQEAIPDRIGLPQRHPEPPGPVIPTRRHGEPDPEDDDQL